jgi:mannose-6-phosphate isomerase-like protein (cupin superfamily)
VTLAATLDVLSDLVPYRVLAGEGRTYSVLGDRVTVKATADATGGAYSLFEGQVRPGSGAPPHIERHEDEAFFVLEGTFALMIGGETVEVGPGGFAFVPRGTPHAFTNVGPETGRLLVLLSPGGIHERYFAELGDPTGAPNVPTGPADIERAIAISAKYGIDFLPPPGA